MHLVSEVIFDYIISSGETYSAMDEFSTPQELKDAIGKIEFSDIPLTVRVNRKVTITDTDSPIPYCSTRNLVHKYEFTSVKFDDKPLKFIIADKLAYPHDVGVLLKEKYGTTLDLRSKKLNKDMPVLYSGVNEDHHFGLKDSMGRQTIQVLRSVKCRNLTEKDIVLDKNLCQIWPTKSKKPFLALERFLRKTKEIVHQK